VNPAFIANQTVYDSAHCVLFVIDATTVEKFSAKYLDKLNHFQKLMNQKGELL